jgi:hypothetical protein
MTAVTAAGRRVLRDEDGEARDAYALLHLPLITGIVLSALGVERVLEHTDPLEAMGAVVSAAVIPLAAAVPALVALEVPAVVWAALIAYETVRDAAYRAEVRAAG